MKWKLKSGKIKEYKKMTKGEKEEVDKGILKGALIGSIGFVVGEMLGSRGRKK